MGASMADFTMPFSRRVGSAPRHKDSALLYKLSLQSEALSHEPS